MPNVVTFTTVWTSCSPASAGPQSVETIRIKMPPAAFVAESTPPTVVLHMQEGLADEAQQRLRDELPDGEDTLGA